MKELPVYKITIDDIEDSGIEYVSLVEKPAIMIKGLAFSDNVEPQYFKFNDDKQIIAGAALIPDLKIYRYDIDLGEYYVVFEKETIEKMVDKFNKTQKEYKINLEHTDKLVPAFIKGSWIIEDMTNDKSRMYGFTDLPVGTWFIEVKIEDKEFWNKEVRGKNRTGFSIEGIMGLTLSSIKNKFEILQGGVASSNVASYRWNSNNNTLVLTFHDGSRYKYYTIDREEFESIILGDATCITEGENEYGRWYEGKSPSVGAAVWKYLIDKNVRYEKMSSMSFESYDDYPKAAQDNACKVLRWRDEHGEDEVDGMTRVGWVRANQLCNGEKISEDTIARMSGFQRHKQNSEISDEFKGTPWKDRGYVAWLGWGGTEGIEWASRKLEQIRQTLSFAKVSFDVDGVIDTEKGKEMLKQAIDNGDEIYIISARQSENNIWDITDKFNIPHSRIFATGSNKSKIEKIKELNIDKHIDNNPDVIKELGNIGLKFINQIKSELKMKTKKLIFRDYTLKSGDKITIDGDMAIGSSVFLVKEDGTREQAPEGEYILEDGTTLFVDAEGYINEVRTAATTETTQNNENLQVTPEEVMAVVNPMFEEMRMVIAELQSRIEVLEGNGMMVVEEAEMKQEFKIHDKINNIRTILNK